MPRHAHFGNRRLDFRRLLVAEEPAFAGVGFSPATAIRGCGMPSARQASKAIWITSSIRCLFHPRDRLGQRHVRADMHYPQVRTDQQHADLLCMGALGQQLGMTGVVKAGGKHGRLVQRRGDDRVHFTGHRHVAGREHIFDRGLAAGWRDFTPGTLGRIGIFQIDQGDRPWLIDRGGRSAGIIDVQRLDAEIRHGAFENAQVADDQRIAALVNVGMRQRLQHDFGADSRGIPHRDRQYRFLRVHPLLVLRERDRTAKRGRRFREAAGSQSPLATEEQNPRSSI